MKKSIKTIMQERGLDLNPQQLAAVKDLKEVSIVNAGAGTGKSSVIVAKTLYAQLMKPDCCVLCISFTKKAVADLQSRILGATNVTVSTFHSFFYRILRSNGYKSFGFIDNDAQRAEIINESISKAGLTDKIDATTLSDCFTKGRFKTDESKAAASAYLNLLKGYRLMDFDSLQYFTHELLQNNPAAAARVRNTYDYILIDEAQDISTIQAEIIKLLYPADCDCNLTIVGDSRQAIYSFRGGKEGVIDELRSFYAAKEYKLDINYRCSASILAVANKLLAASPLKAAKVDNKKEVVFCSPLNELEEAAMVCEQIKKWHNSGARLNDIAVLFRSTPAVSVLSEELLNNFIPHVKVGADSIKWHKGYCKSFLVLLAWLHDKENISDFRKHIRLLGLPNEVLQDIDDTQPLLPQLTVLPSLSQEDKDRIGDFALYPASTMDLIDTVKDIWQMLLKEHYHAKDDTFLDEFLADIKPFADYEALVSHIKKLESAIRAMQKLQADPTADYVRLMSIHAAKGLEYKYVCVVGVAEGVLPDLSHDEVNLAEENRLAYVACTRAMEELFISYPNIAKSGKVNEPSRYFSKFYNANEAAV